MIMILIIVIIVNRGRKEKYVFTPQRHYAPLAYYPTNHPRIGPLQEE